MPASVRQRLIDVLVRDLIGPRSDHETFPELPTVRYLTGILYPAGTPTDELEDDLLLAAGELDEDEEVDEPNPVRQAIRQSSIGLTCEVSGESINVQVRYARYRKTLVDSQEMWCRDSQESGELLIDLSNPGVNAIPLDDAGAELEVNVRSTGENQVRVLTVFLINRAEPSDPVRDTDCIFQPEISVRGAISARKLFNGTLTDSDARSYQLLFRNQPEFVVGHGCGADWSSVDSTQATEVRTVIIPTAELPQVRHYERSDLQGLDMMVLANCADGNEIASRLAPIIDDYSQWIRSTETQAGSLEGSLHETAMLHLAACDEAARRMMDGLELITSDRRVFDAFCFMNTVMAYQRARTEYSKTYKTQGKWPSKTVDPQGRWRPFQIAFILINLRSVIDPTSPERNYADLLWFATGGGKTEAYLGLAAFTLAFRRLRGSHRIRDHAGVTVLMRYTLRLLTVQQYQRATTMICACEYLRKQDPAKWGKEPFLIGLWVGRNTTPNNHRDAQESLNTLKSGTEVKEANPVQLHNCPWCGKELKPADYFIDTRREWMLIHCPNPACDFFGKEDDPDSAIPALTIDDDIYHRCPSLLIGTVDKFARLPWNARTAALFGLVDRWCPRHGFLTAAEEHSAQHRVNRGLPTAAVERSPRLKPPELIIQDELHLISGPLGTMVGHFETAVDFLCSLHGGRAPKVVASTATIRRAGEQVRQLFNREVRQFPPPGIDADDSFFARQVSGPDTPGRKYVGVCATGKSGKTVMVRVFAALLQAAEELKRTGSELKELDPYWTLTSYFNSLKELGAAVRLIEDDVPERLEVLAARPDLARTLELVRELNSRRDATEIPSILAEMEQELTSGKALDILLATNMISVGVDVDRLGLMVVQGQPKGTSEYIQATSRVGRKFPGLIVTMYNWARPRDLSHYERFKAYHGMLYRYVEPTSVTPFSPRARDRGLAALLIGMARLTDDTLARNKDASQMNPSTLTIERVLSVIRNRVDALEPSETTALISELSAAIAKWQSMARRYGTDLKYNRGFYEAEEDAKHILMRRVGEDNGEAWLIPDSLRDVEEEAQLYYWSPRGGTYGG